MEPIRCPHCGLVIVLEQGPEEEDDLDEEEDDDGE